MATPGYSNKTLARKLGFHEDMTIHVIDAPADYAEWLGEIATRLHFQTKIDKNDVKVVHLFCLSKSNLREHLLDLRSRLESDGMIWVSWPKKASKTPTEVTENLIREIALPLGFVDVKVCAVSDVWSGLKLVIRKSERIERSNASNQSTQQGDSGGRNAEHRDEKPPRA